MSGRTGTFGIFSYDDLAVEIDARGENDRVGEDLLTVRQLHAAHRAPGYQHFRTLSLTQSKPFRRAQSVHDHALIERFVLLSAQRKYRRPFCGIEHFDLHERLVRGERHLAAERVYLAHQMSLGGTAYGGIARHHRNRAEIKTQHKRAVPLSGACERGFHAGVPAANDNDLEFVVFHSLIYVVRNVMPPVSHSGCA